jgi:hypothetical protein
MTYHLAGKRGMWTLWREGQTQPVFQARTKPEALAQARALARKHLARLLIHTEKGTLSQERSFRRYRDGAR